MSPTVQILSKEQLEARRAELVREACMSETELRRAAAEYLLNAERTATLDEIDRIDFLLGE